MRTDNHRVGETGLSDSATSSQALAYGIHGITPAPTNFFDHEGSSYFGELEEALMQGVVDRKVFLTTRPPTLEIFPSWPMRFQQTPKNSQSAESTDSGSALNTISQLESDSPVSRKTTSPDQSTEQPHMMIMSRTGEAENHQPKSQEKRRLISERDGRPLDAKTLRRLAQNREAAKKSRLRKKAYVQQLENSRVKLAQLELDLHRARSQGLFLGGVGASASASATMSSGAAVFDIEYARWLDENSKHMMELRNALQTHLCDNDLRIIVDECLVHYDEFFRLKDIATKADVFHLITGMWVTPAERCFLWLGGFKPSELLKIITSQLDPMTEQQLIGICNLQQSSEQAEEALTQGHDQLQQSLAETVANGCLCETTINNVGNNVYMAHINNQMAIALEKLDNLQSFVQQADNLRQQMLHQMRRILTIRQAGRCLLAIGEYYGRLRALSSLWATRPRENLFTEESACPATTDLQIFHHQVPNHFSAF
ncbi:transcription factor TGA protein [Dioscorea alata]|uniref:Transcription factor TGA protein n=3 Tax=Dioscorea alata TaxID=55571 RepID=A0ACB7VCH6_DIOAL|nr:transcription factor TGA protein [Dioscorea alata]KAH7671381.1 transcription factor TGA protein [Dioscorea alata]KAH7671382.1 transcription factor TGA protein [Dioscorea alata]